MVLKSIKSGILIGSVFLIFLAAVFIFLNKRDSFLYAAWIPDWSSDAGYVSLFQNKDFLNSVSPVWHVIHEDGAIEFTPAPNHKKMIELMRANSMQIIPSIPLFDHEIFTTIASDEELFNAHVEALIAIGLDENYDGIDIDYESIKLQDKEKYYEMLKRVSEAMHEKGKMLVVTALAEWDIPKYPSLMETHEVLDYAQINQYADEIRIMTYDYTYPGMLSPGPIAPLNWQRKVIEYALKQGVPPEKLVLGVHLYGYEWFNVVEEGETVVDEAEDTTEVAAGYKDVAETEEGVKAIQHDLTVKYTSDNNSSESEGLRARAYDYRIIAKALEFNGETENFEGEKIYRYSRKYDNGRIENRVLVYLGVEGVVARIKLAKEYGLKGVSFWRLGGDDDLLEEVAKMKD